MRIRQKFLMGLSLLGLAFGGAIATNQVIENYAHSQAQHLANRQGLNGMLHPAAVDAYQTAYHVGAFGGMVGAVVGGVVVLGTIAIASKVSEQKSTAQVVVDELLARELREFSEWKTAQALEYSVRQP